MNRAYVALKSQPWYRREAFVKGLQAAGYDVVVNAPATVEPGDVFLIWNRYAEMHNRATAFEAAGGTVLVAENGYIGTGGTAPKFDVHPYGPQPHHYYALAKGGHNGQGVWPDGGMERFIALGLEMQPLVQQGGHVLVCPNRSFGIPGRMMHPDWGTKTTKNLRNSTDREVRLRAHPGNNAPKRPLSEDLKGCSEVHVWTSSAGVHALLAGVPVVCHAPFWICKAASMARNEIHNTWEWGSQRFNALVRMAWAQWDLDEIQSGRPFDLLR